MNIAELVDIYTKERVLKAQTVRGITVAFRSLTRFLTKDPQIDDIGLDQVVAWRHHIGQSVKDITYNSYLAQIQAVFRFAQIEGYCQLNHPLLSLRKARVERLTPPTVKAEFFETAEMFLTRPAEPWEKGLFEPRWFWWAVILTLSYTAIRRRQLVELRWKDIDWANQSITLRKEGSKNGKSWVIPMTDKVTETFAKIRDYTIVVCGEASLEEQVFNLPLFTKRQGGRPSTGLTADYLSMRMSRLSKIIGVHCSAHKFRHTATTRWLNATGQLKTVRNILGHSSNKATLEYSHPDIDDIRIALKFLK